MDMSRDNLIKTIRDAMEYKSLNTKQLEDLAGISRDSIRDFFRGKTHILRADKLQKVLRVLDPERDPFK